ncbi:hypothetical protein HDZ31DRAFT_38223 [Schizophyllum fasciatum]
MTSSKRTKAILAAVLTSIMFWRASANSHTTTGSRFPGENVVETQQEGLVQSKWSSPHDGWLGRATRIQASALPTNLSSDSLLFAVTVSGMMGDSVWLAVFASPDRVDCPLRKDDDVEPELEGQMPLAAYSLPQDDAAGKGDVKHIAVDALGHVWRLDNRDYAAFLELARAADAETTGVKDYYVAHTVTCQPTIYLVLPFQDQDASAEHAAERLRLRTVGVDAYTKRERQLARPPSPSGHAQTSTKSLDDGAGVLPAALHELLGLAQEGSEGMWDEIPDAQVLYSIQDALPRSLLSSMYLRTDCTQS